VTKFCFLDLETTGLSDLCDLWEIGAIVHGPDEGDDVEYCWQIRPDLTWAEPKALQISRYYQRCQLVDAEIGAALVVADPGPEQDPFVAGLRAEVAQAYPPKTTSVAVAARLAQMLDGAYLVAANVAFDDRFLQAFLRDNGQCGSNEYHLIDVEAFAAGALRMPPKWNLNRLLDQFGIEVDEADRHTALGDARLVRDLYDAVMGSR